MERKSKLMQARNVIFVFLDVLIVIASMGGALWFRCDFQIENIDPVFLDSVYHYILINAICTVVINYLFKLYHILWGFASMEELKNVIGAVITSTLAQYIGMNLLGLQMPRSYPLIYVMILSILTICSRFSYRFIRIAMHNFVNSREQEPVRTMIVGAGAAGYMIAREMKNSKHLNRKIPCIIDDDEKKIGTFLQGIPIVGKKEDIPYFAQKYDIQDIVIAIPTISSAAKKELLEICQETSCKVLLLPGIYQLVNEEVNVSMLREIRIEDLLGREPIKLQMDEIMEYVTGKVLLVTGGGGSIGSEICRQIALHQPRQLIIFDIYENNAYEIQNELKKEYPDLDLVVLIGSVRDRKRVDSIFDKYRPEIVFHAAAHKHVPLMEDSPNEAIKNNVLGTWNVARAADAFHVKKMVLISTDKAVRPTNIMGASKRVCELIILSFAQHSATEYAAVRFGNVLGSNGSVIPLFEKQIAQGGPVTVTHPDIIRYFMTIPEAVNLVLQCGALAKGGEIFILDMGEPVKILDLAKKMIRLSGHEPDKDIPIVFTGLRPGEKLYEELLINEDNLQKTIHEKIFVARQAPVDSDSIQQLVREMVSQSYEETDGIREAVKKLVPEYTPRSNKKADPCKA